MTWTCFTALLMILSSTSAQTIQRQVLATGGNTSVSGDLTLCWTMGQPGPVEVAVSPAIIITQGFQQSEDLELGISELAIGDDQAKVYPNPCKGVITLEGTITHSPLLLYFIYDSKGSSLGNGEIIIQPDGRFIKAIDISAFSMGTNLLRLHKPGNNLAEDFIFKLVLLPQ